MLPRAFQTLEAKFDISDSSKVHEAVLGSAGQASVLGTTQLFRAPLLKKMPAILQIISHHACKKGLKRWMATPFLFASPFVGKSSCFCSLSRLLHGAFVSDFNVYYTLGREGKGVSALLARTNQIFCTAEIPLQQQGKNSSIGKRRTKGAQVALGNVLA